MLVKTSFLLALLAILGAGCHRIERLHAVSQHQLPSLAAAAAPFLGIRLEDDTARAHLNFVHSIGEEQPTNIIEATGSGAAWLDYDGDGRMDLYLVTGVPKPPFTKGRAPSFQPHNRLFHNNGDGTFTDVTDRAGVALGRFSLGATTADYDNDGHPDIFVACYDGPNALFHNNGDGTFTDVAKEAGVADRSCSVYGCFFDYDNDGRLDLYVVNYIIFDPNYKYYYNPDGFPGPLAFEGQADVLYHNEGNGTFRNVTKSLGVYNPSGRGMGAVAFDYDEDGFMDLYVANDSMTKWLYHNERGRGFREVGARAGVALNVAGEGTASMMGTCADYDGDGRPDLFVPDNSFKSLFHNEGNGAFADLTAQSGIAAAGGQYVTWGAGFLDVDNDGSPDLLLINGALHHLWGQEALLLRNRGDGQFQDISADAGDFFKTKFCGRGAAFADFLNDGNVGLCIVPLNAPAILLQNTTGLHNNWIELQLVGARSNRDGIGAKIRVTASGHTQYAQRTGGGAFLSTNDPRIHFGLGKARKVDRIEIRWPSGRTQVLRDLPVNRILTVQEPAG
ncbi:MAG: CRTAC1 family protein [Chthonomonadales bacterium]